MKRAALRLWYTANILQGVQYLADRWSVSRSEGGRLRLRRRARSCFPILTYHRVNRAEDPFAIDMLPAKVFEDQMRCVARNYTVLSLEEIVACLANGRSLPVNCLAITFDDGYADNYHFAYPILKSLGLPATFFLTTDAIGSGMVLWFDQVLRAFSGVGRRRAHLPFATGPQNLETQADRARLATQALFWLRGLTKLQRDAGLAALFASLEVVPQAKDPDLMLTWEQVHQMAADGFRFGSHTLTHPILSQLSLAEAAHEIEQSKRRIETALGRPVTTFAYPSGRPQDYSSDIVNLVRDAGYAAAVTNATFRVNEIGEDLYRLNRLRPWESDVASFYFKLCWYKLRSPGQPIHAGESQPSSKSLAQRTICR